MKTMIVKAKFSFKSMVADKWPWPVRIFTEVGMSNSAYIWTDVRKSKFA